MPEKKTQAPPIRISTLEVVIVFLITLCVLMLVTNNVESFFRLLYNPVSFLILVIVLAEYIVLKSADRTRIYRIEVDQLRSRLLEQVKAQHQIEQAIDDIEDIIHDIETRHKDPEVKNAVGNIRERLTRIRKDIRSS